MCTPSPSKNKNRFRGGLNIGIGYLWGSSTHSKMAETVSGISGVGSCTGIIKRCTLGLSNQQTVIYAPATELDIIRFWLFPFRDIMWHLITKVNGGILSVYINVFEPMRGKQRRLTPFLVYALVYPNIASNLVNLYNLSPWSEYLCMHTCSPFYRNPLLR